MTTKSRATIEDLYKVPENGKAEIVNGELVQMSPTGGDPNYAAGEVFVSLHSYSKQTKTGRAVSDNAGFRVKLPGRESFSPDAAFYIGPNPGMKFFEGAPAFAVEVRSENDYGQEAERAIAAKCKDYFLAGTRIVWDVDLLSPDVIKAYYHNDPDNPKIFRRGDMADAEPVLPGWRMSVDDLFPQE
jgi:Uma2 family endonuclease